MSQTTSPNSAQSNPASGANNPRRRRKRAEPAEVSRDTKMLDAALEYAKRGWPVFPCRSGAKEPLISKEQGGHGAHDATTDPKQIREWWTASPNANIGCHVGAANMMVVDLDPAHNLDDLAISLGEPLGHTLLEVKTPKPKGRHLYYALAEGETVPQSTGALSIGVDVRSDSSYILLPPSHTVKGKRTVDGDYTWVGDPNAKPAFRSDKLFAKATERRAERHPDHDKWIIPEDLPENKEAAIEWLKNTAKPAIKGQGGNKMACDTGCMMRSYGLSPETGLEIMWDHWAPRCTPAWVQLRQPRDPCRSCLPVREEPAWQRDAGLP
jgi:hypothetical protein